MSKARDLADLAKNANDRLDTVAASDGALSNRNMVINGAMTVDQRNGGSAVTMSAGIATFSADRFSGYAGTTATITQQQVADAPEGFQNSNKLTCTVAATADTNASRAQLLHLIEGYNSAPLQLGTSSATSMTLSFWVKASNAGTYGGSFVNGAANRSYPYHYTISAANTWEKKIITIAGDTSGTWATDNTTGLFLAWSLGVGSDFEGTLDQWNGAYDLAPASSFSLKDNLNATWQITGVQLEVGDTATPFEHRSYGDELARCQRYYEQIDYETDYSWIGVGVGASGTEVQAQIRYSKKRTAPSVSATGTFVCYDGIDRAVTSQSFIHIASTRCTGVFNSSNISSGRAYKVQFHFSGDRNIRIDAEL